MVFENSRFENVSKIGQAHVQLEVYCSSSARWSIIFIHNVFFERTVKLQNCDKCGILNYIVRKEIFVWQVLFPFTKFSSVTDFICLWHFLCVTKCYIYISQGTFCPKCPLQGWPLSLIFRPHPYVFGAMRIRKIGNPLSLGGGGSKGPTAYQIDECSIIGV